MSNSLVMALGLFLVIEGLTYALVPAKMQQMMKSLIDLAPEKLRIMGTAVLAVGVFVIWLAQ